MFKGGIHLPGFKEASRKPLREFPLVKKYIIPLSQHAGAPAVPIVKVGERVLKYQKIAQAAGKISANIHAPVSGKVIEISEHVHPLFSSKVPAIIIESDGADMALIVTKTYKDYYRYSPQELIDIIFENGVVGLGGAQFPTHIKLNPPKEVDTLILNGCECEPCISCDDKLMQEKADEIIEGMKVMMYILNVTHGIVAIEDNKPLAIESMRKKIFREPNIELVVVKTRYPQGAEKQLIKTILNREVPPGGLPYDVGVVVHNVQTAYSVYVAVHQNLPLISRVTTIYSKNGGDDGNYIIRFGTPVYEIVKHCEINDFNKVVFGGIMMGVPVGDLSVAIIKGTSAVLFLKENYQQTGYQMCIRCGRCVRSCPMNLLPNMLGILSQNMNWEQTRKYFLFDCIECGVCSYVCPAKIPIVSLIKLAKIHAK